MAASDYLTLTEMLERLGLQDTEDNTRLTNLITRASRAIDKHCHTRFYTTSSDETKYYSPADWNTCPTDDLLSVTSLATDLNGDRAYSTIWAATDFELWPWNAVADGKPYREIRRTPLAGNFFPNIGSNPPFNAWPYGNKSVKVIGKFGYAATAPEPIAEACALLVARLYKRATAVFGVAGSAAFGQISMQVPQDPDVLALLDPFVRSIYGPA